jgi:hypothetical protein
MKDPFLLFCGDRYYPLGGAEDYKGQYATLEDAVEAGKASRHDWYNILDIETGKIYPSYELP